MLALILGAPGGLDDIERPVVGTPLLVHQMNWLIQSGVTRIVVNRVADADRGARARAIDSGSLGEKLVAIPSAAPLTALELSRRAGASDAVAVVVPHAALGNVDLTAATALALARGCDVRVEVGDAHVTVVHLGGAREEELLAADGWLRVVTGEVAAHRLTLEVLRGRVDGLVVRGTEVTPGIFRARGAVVADGAELEAPCLIGPDCFVASGARVGPGAVLDAKVVVEAGAIVEDARVGEGVVVGQGVTIAHAHATGTQILVHGGVDVTIDDPLLTTARGENDWLARATAALVLAVVAKPARIANVATSAVQTLERIATGEGRWFGFADADKPCLLDVSPGLVADTTDEESRAAARALYIAKKSPRLDASLAATVVLGWLRGRLA